MTNAPSDTSALPSDRAKGNKQDGKSRYLHVLLFLLAPHFGIFEAFRSVCFDSEFSRRYIANGGKTHCSAPQNSYSSYVPQAILNFFSPPASVSIQLQGAQRTIQVLTWIFLGLSSFEQVANETGGTDIVPLYLGGDAVSGIVAVNVNAGKKLEHAGIKVELIGQIGMSPKEHSRISNVRIRAVLRSKQSIRVHVRHP